jgi:hypothetical protein
MIDRPDRHRHVAVVTLLVAALAGCASVPSQPARLAKSSHGCMKAVVDGKLPAGIPDSHAHCLASGLITRYCSVSEAYLAGAGKELKDLLGPGDAEWRDWRADRAGIECAKSAEDDDALAACCSAGGY